MDGSSSPDGGGGGGFEGRRPDSREISWKAESWFITESFGAAKITDAGAHTRLLGGPGSLVLYLIQTGTHLVIWSVADF